MSNKDKRPNRKNYNRSNRASNQLYSNLGVRDLREILDKKRQEKLEKPSTSKIVSSPPPDPVYSFLKDPSREGPSRSPINNNNNNKPITQTHKQRSFTDKSRPNFKQHQSLIENPYNIKIEFSTSTGEHVYTVDTNTTLPNIKHVPDNKSQGRYFVKNPRGRGFSRGRRSNNRNYQDQARNIYKNKANLDDKIEIGYNKNEKECENLSENENSNKIAYNERENDSLTPSIEGKIDEKNNELKENLEKEDCDKKDNKNVDPVDEGSKTTEIEKK